MRTGVPCNENRFSPVRISTQGKTCSGLVLALYGIGAFWECGSGHRQKKETRFFGAGDKKKKEKSVRDTKVLSTW